MVVWYKTITYMLLLVTYVIVVRFKLSQIGIVHNLKNYFDMILNSRDVMHRFCSIQLLEIQLRKMHRLIILAYEGLRSLIMPRLDLKAFVPELYHVLI